MWLQKKLKFLLKQGKNSISHLPEHLKNNTSHTYAAVTFIKIVLFYLQFMLEASFECDHIMNLCFLCKMFLSTA